jgi:hypothetical protein
VRFFLQVYQLKFHMNFSSLQWVLPSPRISSSLIWLA